MNLDLVNTTIESYEKRIGVLRNWLSAEDNCAPVEVIVVVQIALEKMEEDTLPWWKKHKEDMLQRKRLRGEEVEHETV